MIVCGLSAISSQDNYAFLDVVPGKLLKLHLWHNKYKQRVIYYFNLLSSVKINTFSIPTRKNPIHSDWKSSSIPNMLTGNNRNRVSVPIFGECFCSRNFYFVKYNKFGYFYFDDEMYTN